MVRHGPMDHVVLVRRGGGDRGGREDHQSVLRVRGRGGHEGHDLVQRGAGRDVHEGRDGLGHREGRILLVLQSRDGRDGCHSGRVGHGADLPRHRSLIRMDLRRYRCRCRRRSSRRPSHRRARDGADARRGEEGHEVLEEEAGHAGELRGMVVEEDHDEAGLQGHQRADVPMTMDRTEKDEDLQIEDRGDLRGLRLARCRCCDLDRPAEQRMDGCCLAARG